jgi:hypothetical protein
MTKQLYKVEAFVWRLGERVVKRCKYTRAYSKAQAVVQAFKGVSLPDEWEICAEEVNA